MNNHPLITQQIAAAREHELLAAAAHRRLLDRSRAPRSTDRRHRRRALGARTPQPRCASC